MNASPVLSTFDFEDAYERNPEQAVAWMQLLLLDEAALADRIDHQRACAEVGAEERAPASLRPDYESEYDLICNTGLFAAHEQGLLNDQARRERLALLINDPDALLEAHGRLTGKAGDHRAALPAAGARPETAAGSKAVPARARTAADRDRWDGKLRRDRESAGGETAAGFTSLVAAGRWPELEEKLSRYVPDMLRVVGLPATLAEALQRDILDRLQNLGLQGRRFGEVLPDWLAEFAQARGTTLPRPLTPESWRALLEARSMRTVLERSPAGEPEWARQFRQLALRQGLTSGQDLLRVGLAEPLNRIAALPMFRRDLLSQVQKEREEALRFFELN